MEIIAGLFLTALYQLTEKVWEKGLDAAWDPLQESLKSTFSRLAGKDQETKRREQFAEAYRKAIRYTTKRAQNPEEAAEILSVLDKGIRPTAVAVLAEEAAKVVLYADSPDMERMAQTCQESLKWDTFWQNSFEQKTLPDTKRIVEILLAFLSNLRKFLIDQSSYKELTQQEILKTLQRMEERAREAVPFDDIERYLEQVIHHYESLDFVGIPELSNRQSVRIDDIFIHLQASSD